VELVKARGYGEQGSQAAQSAINALRLALSAVLRLFAPFLPFVAEEAWSWWQEGSIHRAPWPDPGELRTAAVGADPGRGHAVTAGAEAARVLDAASAAIAAVRGAKSAARLSMRAPVRKLVVSAGEDDITAVRAVLRDVQAAGKVEQIVVRPSASARPVHQVTL
jgi:valyl-tRNA synthetase